MVVSVVKPRPFVESLALLRREASFKNFRRQLAVEGKSLVAANDVS